MARGDLTDEEWDVIEGLLPSERGRKSRPAHDNRRFLNGMLHVLRVGCPWRDMHERYGKWNSIYVRFRRWAEQGVWDAILATLVEFGQTDDWQHMIDSTTVRVICPPLSGPETMIVWTTKGTMNAEQEAQAGRNYRQAA